MNKVAEIRMIPIADLKLAEYNPRKKLKPTDREYRELKKSIEEHGFAESIVVNKDLTVIGGHQRFLLRSGLVIRNCHALSWIWISSMKRR